MASPDNDTYQDSEPRPGDGPDYHADHAAWLRRRCESCGSLAKIRLADGSTWCESCDEAAQGHDYWELP